MGYNITFGIPPVIKKELCEYGTEMKVTELTREYEDGKMDVRTVGVGIFRILEVVRNMPNKLYAAAVVQEVSYLPYDTDELHPRLAELMDRLHEVTGTGFDWRKKFDKPLSFQVAQFAALAPEDQYRLLTNFSERGRQWFLIQHLERVIPELEAAEQMRKKVKMNGHFRKLTPPEI